MNNMPPDVWQWLAVAALSIVVALMGAIIRDIRGDAKAMRKDHDAFKEQMLTSFHNKDDLEKILSTVRSAIDEVKDSVKEVHRRLDSVLAFIKPG
jgi:uncharacterized coiled-coil DUF342 family protein